MRRRRALALGGAAIGSVYGVWAGDIGTPKERGSEAGTNPPLTAANRERGTEGGDPSADATASIGGSLNGRPRRLDGHFGLVEESGVRRMHAFFDVRDKYESDVSPEEDPDVAALRRLGREFGLDLTVSLQWDFAGLFGDKETRNVPPSGSAHERALFEYATDLLAAVDYPVDAVLLANEPVWETPDEDVLGRDPPFVAFTRGLKDHLVRHYDGGDPRYLVGSFNRLYDQGVANRYRSFYDRLFRMVRDDADVDGVDLHVHYDGLREAEQMFAVARREVPDGTVTATELSPVWRYYHNKDTPIGEFDGGRRFAERYGFSDEMTGQEYFGTAKDDPRPPAEMADFMETVPWYNVRFVEDVCDLMDRYDVEFGAFGFLLDRGVRHAEWGPDWRPFQINYLFQPGLIDSEDGAHPHYLDDFRRRT